jgi:hypothetical protein
MSRFIKWALFVSLLSTLFATAASAQTIPSASCNSSDVQTALNSVSADGTTVTIPAGNCSWTTSVTYNQVYSTTILGAGNQSTLGGGDVTVITDNVNHSKTDYTLQLNVVTGKSLRLSGITIQAGSGGTSNNGVLVIGGSSQALRVDHCHFYKNDQLQVGISGQIYGVFDHDLFDNSNLGLRIAAPNWNGGSNGDGSWADSTTFGSNRFIYVENSTFNSTSSGVPTPANDCISAGRFVFRFDTFSNGAALQTHPTGHDGSTGNDRGCRAWEIYDNIFLNTGPTPEYNSMFESAGTGLAWGNSALAGYEHFITLHSMRSDNSTYTQTATPAGWGYCGTAFNGTGSKWDQMTNAVTGYACLDQPGRGKGDLLAGSMPQRCDVTVGDCNAHMYTGRWPAEALEPVYEWADQWVPVPGYPGAFISNDNPNQLEQNQDWYTYTQSWNGSAFNGTAFDGTAGTGSGTLAARPSTCLPGVGYWAVDQGNWNTTSVAGPVSATVGLQGAFFTCTAVNTWTLYYMPYTYPHPLTLSSGSGNGPAPPTNLTATVQ